MLTVSLAKRRMIINKQSMRKALFSQMINQDLSMFMIRKSIFCMTLQSFWRKRQTHMTCFTFLNKTHICSESKRLLSTVNHTEGHSSGYSMWVVSWWDPATMFCEMFCLCVWMSANVFNKRRINSPREAQRRLSLSDPPQSAAVSHVPLKHSTQDNHKKTTAE